MDPEVRHPGHPPTMMTRRAILSTLVVATLVFSLSQEAHAKCPVFTVVIDGELHSGEGKETIIVSVHENRRNKISQTELKPENHRFHATIPFDTFVSVHPFGGHNCSRVPTRIDVVLLEGGVAKQTVTLSLDHDFDWDAKLAEWRVKAPVEF